MTKYFICFIYCITLLLGSVGANANQFVLFVFQDERPVANAMLDVNGEPMGISDENGRVVLDLKAGKYSLLLSTSASLSAKFKLTFKEDENVEVSVAFLPPANPDIKIEKYKVDEVIDENTPRGLLTGQVTAALSFEPIRNAQLYVEALGLSTQTDELGYFKFELPRGEHQIYLSHPDFNSKTVDKVRMSASVVTEINFKLVKDNNMFTAPTLESVEELHVVGKYISDSAFEKERMSSGVMDAMDADDFAVSGDSSAVFALQRVTGVTVVDGKYVYVRGLGERYSSTLLNGTILPSPDLARRVVPLDMFPTGVLEQVSVSKTYSPDLPADYSGGAINLVTRKVPDEALRQFSFQLGANSQTLGDEGLSYNGGDDDWLGYDDGARELPALLAYYRDNQITLSGEALSAQERDAAGESLRNNYQVETKDMGPDIDMSLVLGNRYDTDSGNNWGYMFSVKYKNYWSYRSEQRANYGLGVENSLVQQDHSILNATNNGVDLATMLNLSYELGQDHVFESNTLLTRRSDANVIREIGYLDENDLDVIDTTLEWVERELFTQYFGGEHTLLALNNTVVNWHASFSTATHYKPDSRFYRYELLNSGVYAFDTDGTGNERTFEEMDDESSDFGVNLSIPFDVTDDISTTLKIGVNQSDRERTFAYSRYRFSTDTSTNTLADGLLESPSPEAILTPENIRSDGFRLQNNNLATDNYTAEHSISAYYLMADSEVANTFRLMFGFRVEDSDPNVSTFRLSNPEEVVIGGEKDKQSLPVILATWFINDDMQLRFGMSETLNRPDIRELSPAPFIDPESRYVFEGNAELVTANIQNFDLRWEWYGQDLDKIQVALFYKEFENPIEKVIRPGAGGIRTFQNADFAENTGIEFQVRKHLGFIKTDWSDYFVKANMAVIDSKVNIANNTGIGIINTNTERELQGQSPWTLNLQLGYDNLSTQTQFSVLLNVAGERIVDVGTRGLPDAYEQSAARLDVVYNRTIRDAWELQLKVQNLLNPDVEVQQGDQFQRVYQRGVAYSAKLAYRF